MDKALIVNRCVIDPTSGCWIWQAACNEAGYGVVSINNKNYTAHRVSYMAYKGDIPKGGHICHKCDNPPCANPDHLFLGSHQDNMRDKQSKGRAITTIGYKLTPSNVQVIRTMCATVPFPQIAAQFGVSTYTVRRIHNRSIWKHIPDITLIVDDLLLKAYNES